MQNTEEIIKSFLTSMVTQNCRATAAPFFYVIKDIRKRFVDDDYAGRNYLFDDDGNYFTYKQYCKKIRQGEIEYDFDNPEKVPTEEEFAELSHIRHGFFEDEEFFIENALFFTESDAENHLKANNYHYSEKAHTYVMHAWRAPELRHFFSALLQHFGIAPQNSYTELIPRERGLNEK